MNDNEIIPGDWIIHAGPIDLGPVMALTQYSVGTVWVIEATPDHLVVYDPCMADEVILDRAMYPRWRLATAAMVDATWKRAMQVAGLPEWRVAPVTIREMAAYPIRKA